MSSTQRLTASERPISEILKSYEPSVIHSGAIILIRRPGAVLIMYTRPIAPGSTPPADALESAKTRFLSTPSIAKDIRLRVRTVPSRGTIARSDGSSGQSN